MKRLISIWSVLLTYFLTYIPTIIVAEASDITSPDVKKSCTIELRSNSVSGYFLQAATPNDAAKIYIRHGNKKDSQYYLYTDCDSIIINDSTGNILPSNKFYSIAGFKNTTNLHIWSGKRGNNLKLETDQTHNIDNRRTDYIVFTNRRQWVDNLSIKDDKLKDIIKFKLRDMSFEPKDSLLSLKLNVLRNMNTKNKDSSIVLYSHVKQGNLILCFDTILLDTKDSITSILLDRNVKNRFVLCELETNNFGIATDLHTAEGYVDSDEDDVLYSSRFTLTPINAIQKQDVYIISIKGLGLTKDGVQPLLVEIPIMWKSSHSFEKIEDIWNEVWLYIRKLWILILIILLASLVLVIDFWWFAKSRNSNNDTRQISNNGTTVALKHDHKGSEEAEIMNLKSQIDELKKAKGKVEGDLKKLRESAQTKDTEIVSLNKKIREYNQKITDITHAHEEALEEQQRALVQQKQQLEELFEKERIEFRTRIKQLESDNKALNIKVNIGRDELFEQFKNRLKEVMTALEELSNALVRIPEEDDIFSSTLHNLLNDFELMYSDVANIDANNLDINKLREELQHLSKRHLSSVGWMNKIAVWTSYSKVETVNKEFAKHGIHAYALEKLSAMINVLLGAIDISMVVPTVLLSKFDSKQYESTNEEVWIDKYCSEISIYSYTGVVLDIVQVGYSVADKESHKPVVLYN